jgi:hypothetical protein
MLVGHSDQMTPASQQLTAVSPAVTSVVHLLHAGLVIVAALVVLAMLSPLAIRRRHNAITDLRAAAAAGSLVQLAELRAAEVIADRARDRRTAVIVAAAGSLVAAGVHVAVCPEHFHEALRLGVFFVIASLTQTGWAVLLVRRPSRVMFAIGLAGNLGMVVLWTLTRTVGLPFHLAEVEAVGVVDAIATSAEIVTIVSCLVGGGWMARLHHHGTIAISGRA